MYPRNAASPPRIAVGTVVQISDGAVQTSGCTVRVLEQGGTEGDGAGTTAYSTDGVVLYTPTQAETDQSTFILIAKKTGCIPVAITIVTTASATAGYAGLDWAVISAPTTTVNLSGTTIKTATDVETDTADIQTRLPAALVSGRIDASVGAAAANVITASSLATDAVAEIADGVWDEAIAGHLSAGSTGEALDNAGAAGTPPTAAAIADAVWDEARSGHTTVGTFGQGVASVQGSITGSVANVVGQVGGDIVGSVLGDIEGSVFSVVQAVDITSSIKQNQALANFEFLMTDSTTHAPATGATVTVTRSIDGAAFGAGALSAVTEVSNGIYRVDFAAADLNGKVVTLRATASGCDDTFERIITQP